MQNTISHFVEKENDEVVEEEGEDLSKLDETTDWKAKAQAIAQKAKEDGIRNRERSKALKERLAALEKPPEKIKSGEFGLLEKTYLRAAGITAEDEIELAKEVQKKTGLEWDALVDDDYFKLRLHKLRTAKANTDATSDVKGNAGGTTDKTTPEYWMERGELPESTPQNRKLLAAIARKMVESKKSGKKFYNE